MKENREVGNRLGGRKEERGGLAGGLASGQPEGAGRLGFRSVKYFIMGSFTNTL